MRAFVAIEVSEGVAVRLADVQLRLQEALGGRAVRWVRADAIHMTLKFLGEISAEQASRLSQVLGRAAQSAEPFALTAAGMGCFPDCRRPRLLWAGVDGDATALKRLQSAAESCAVRLGYAPDRRRFSAHLTIGRVRSGLQRVEAHALREAMRGVGEERFAQWRVTEMVLMQSTLARSGAQYGCWARMPFQQDYRITIG
ncbi:MAG: RNA 2',3'-cyclic phosphodiesterase [Anaerolineales bacterium]|jgi:2'-5' RNA ligase|nr:RNA 2',3'-cyclic phosphodiesterase [Anaerolineales bacterium]HJO33418.1 RNA 2',3'-cyclic phosphodiesterase [Anaerolineales bacterium]|tara:strand:+ start:68 stop:664 length:597 start_codon:yes stop_codon:yes gene_type:complete